MKNNLISAVKNQARAGQQKRNFAGHHCGFANETGLAAAFGSDFPGNILLARMMIGGSPKPKKKS